MPSGWNISLDTTAPEAIPYFCWDVPVTNARLRELLRDGTDEDRAFWVARILAEAQYADVWKYLSLHDDVLPLWESVRSRLGRRRSMWEFLLGIWRQDGLL
jgi:hypothetical protein